MGDENRKMTDAELSRALGKSSGGRMAGKLLAAVGFVVAVAGVLLGNFVVMIFGGVVLALGQMLQGKARDQVNQQTFEGVAPDILGAISGYRSEPARSEAAVPGGYEYSGADARLLSRQRVYPRNVPGKNRRALHSEAGGF